MVRRTAVPIAVRPRKAAPAPPTDSGSAPATRDPEADPRYGTWYARFRRATLGPDVPPREDASFDREDAKALAERAGRNAALAVFGELVSTGVPVDVAAVRTVRRLSGTGQRYTARAFALGMEAQVGGEVTQVCLGVVADAMTEFTHSWARFRKVEPATLARLAPIEALTGALHAGTPEARAVVESLAADAAARDLHELVELAGRLLVTGHHDTFRAVLAEATSRDPAGESERDVAALDNLARWAEPAAASEPEAGEVVLGVIDYHQPDYDRASRNVGDYVQTLAMLGHLARFQGVRFRGDHGLTELMADLQARVKARLLLPDVEGRVLVLPVSRDFSAGERLPSDTWMLAFGWHMHSTFGLGFGLPYNERINPLFVSFHVQHPALLTPGAQAYLREHGPIGCRDWTTVDLLLSHGVDAFFTGCLTTTVDAVFPDPGDVAHSRERVVGAIDVPPAAMRRIKRPKEKITHGGLEYRAADLVTGVRAAIELLSGYQTRFRRIVTSRLHAYLPATSLGVPVAFRPATLSDVRFEGLLGLTPNSRELNAMRDGLRELIRPVLAAVLQGSGREEVYALWRELARPMVDQARARFSAPPAVEPVAFDLEAVFAEVHASAQTYGPLDRAGSDQGVATDVAMGLDANFKSLLPVAMESLVGHASGPLRLWVTARGLDPDYWHWLSAAFPNLPITVFSFDHVDYGQITRMLRHISVACMDRLLLSETLPGLDRITYVDVDTVTEGDICELARTDLKGRPLAARTGLQMAATEWREAGDAMPPEVASDFRRLVAARHRLDFPTFNAGVVVMDLARMRADRFVARYLPLAATYGLNDQDVLNLYVGADRVELEPRWNRFPLLEDVTEPGIAHYVGASKPWDDRLVPAGDLWRRYAEQFDARTGGRRLR